RAVSRQSESLPEASRQEHLRAALDINRRAEEALPDGREWRALWLQRAGLHRGLGQSDEAGRFQLKAARLTPQGARDRILAAIEVREEGRAREAIRLLKVAAELIREHTRANPRDSRGWFLRANCHELLLEDTDALRCYTVFIALNPNS